MRLHGIDRDAFERFTSTKASWEYAVVAPGYKYNMTDLASAIGRAQLKKADAFWKARQDLVKAYLERLADVRSQHPRIELRLLTHNNKVDLSAESLDYCVRFGDGAWRSVEADHLMAAPLSPLCAPAALAQLRHPDDLSKLTLLRSYRNVDWQTWLRAAGASGITPRGPLFDASALMVQAAMVGEGVALAPPRMFLRELTQGRLAQPFDLEVDVGGYWLTRLLSKEATPAMRAFRAWLLAVV